MRRLIASAAAAATVAGGLALVPRAEASPPVSSPVLGCDPIDPAHCLLPFPSNHFTVADPGSETGVRVHFPVQTMPQNVAGKPIDPTEWNRQDGFSPGTPVVAFVPGLDLHQTWGTAGLGAGDVHNGRTLRRPEDRDHLADLSRYAAADAPILLLNARTGERHPFWSELDTNAGTGDDERALIIRPAVNLTEGDRYLVVLRDLRSGDGSVIEAGETFASFRGDAAPVAGLEDPATATRRQEIRAILGEAATAEAGRGVAFDPSEAYLAWDFTVASAEDLSIRARHIRNDAFARFLGDHDLRDRNITGAAPEVRAVTVTERHDDGPDADPANDRTIVSGRIVVPNYLDLDAEIEQGSVPVTGGVAAPGRRLNDADQDGRASHNELQPVLELPFDCQVPHSATAENPADLVQYGHGLLGSRGEAMGGSTRDLRHNNFAVCATDWIGMSNGDIPNVGTILFDLSNFPSLVDRSIQGFLAKMWLSRWMAHPEGLAAVEGIGDRVTSGQVDYLGNSQGAIMGGSLVALSPDFRRGVLGVPGMNYSTLLNRSVDFEGVFSIPLYAAYPDKIEQQVLFGLMQMLWDRAETNGYAAHATDRPYRDTPAHQILLQVAFDDHQVANVSAEVEARTMGASVKNPMLPDIADAGLPAGSDLGAGNGLHWSLDPTFGLPEVEFAPIGGESVWGHCPLSFCTPVMGSVLEYWYSLDNGNVTPPNGNVPPVGDGADPHEHPRRDDAASAQVARFLRTGQLVDVCDAGPCLTSAASRG